jgi:hypothetical protein
MFPHQEADTAFFSNKLVFSLLLLGKQQQAELNILAINESDFQCA